VVVRPNAAKPFAGASNAMHNAAPNSKDARDRPRLMIVLRSVFMSFDPFAMPSWHSELAYPKFSTYRWPPYRQFGGCRALCFLCSF
jgi:hypothetical protein